MFTPIHTSKQICYIGTLHMQRGKKKSQRPRVSGRISARRTFIQKKTTITQLLRRPGQ